MARCTPERHTRGARTTQARDRCRRARSDRYLHRGGRPRSSIWWRAWLAKLLPIVEDAPGDPPPPAAPVPVSSALDQQAGTLSVTFDAPLDPESSVVASQLRYGNGVEMHLGFGTVQYAGAMLTVSIVTPPSLPFGSGAWLFAGAGELRGVSGEVVQPFGPV